MVPYKITALLILAAFYAVYFGKMILQKRKGIRTDQIAAGKARNREFYIELIMKIATLSVVFAEAASILSDWSLLPETLRISGICTGIAGDVIFGISVWTMRDSWRAGLARGDETEMITGGIYRVSRNPAFVGFDLVYLGILLIFFNPVLFLFSVFAMAMLHLQILQEEKYLPEAFGEKYIQYREKVHRYVGIKSGVVLFAVIAVMTQIGIILICKADL